jgi:rhamnosyltransferase
MPERADVTVIVRARDEEAAIARALASVRRQTVASELLVVDSGSRDGTVAIASQWADRVIACPPERFTYGYALNLGADAARTRFHVALSAHCALPAPDWLERCLELYARPDVAAVAGRAPGEPRMPASGPFYQDLAHARSHPWWGFSNHASSWRADVWRELRFDETLAYAEDKEWALRVLARGYAIAFDDQLWVDMSHQWRGGAREWCSRQWRAARAIASFSSDARYGLREVVADWWHVPPGARPPWQRRLKPARAAGLVARYAGFQAGRRTPHRPVRPG